MMHYKLELHMPIMLLIVIDIVGTTKLIIQKCTSCNNDFYPPECARCDESRLQALMTFCPSIDPPPLLEKKEGRRELEHLQTLHT